MKQTPAKQTPMKQRPVQNPAVAKAIAGSKQLRGSPTNGDAAAPPDATMALATTTALANSAAGQAALVKVTNAASLEKATALLVTISDVRKQVEAKRVELVKPLNEHVKRINAMFRPALDNLDAADTALRNKALAYRAAELARVEQQRSELMATAVEAQEKGNDKAAERAAVKALAVMSPPRVMASAAGQVATRKSWTFEVVDVGAVPDEYWSLDESKVRAAVKAGLRELPGVRIFEVESLAVGGR